MLMPRDLVRELDELPDEPVLTWKPEVHDTLSGCVVTRGQVASKFSTTPVDHVIVVTEHGEYVQVFGHHAVLARELRNADPQPGDQIAIRRLPDLPGKSYRRYRVLVEHCDVGYPEPDPEPEPPEPEPEPEPDDIEAALGPSEVE